MPEYVLQILTVVFYFAVLFLSVNAVINGVKKSADQEVSSAAKVVFSVLHGLSGVTIIVVYLKAFVDCFGKYKENLWETFDHLVIGLNSFALDSFSRFYLLAAPLLLLIGVSGIVTDVIFSRQVYEVDIKFRVYNVCALASAVILVLIVML